MLEVKGITGKLAMRSQKSVEDHLMIPASLDSG